MYIHIINLLAASLLPVEVAPNWMPGRDVHLRRGGPKLACEAINLSQSQYTMLLITTCVSLVFTTINTMYTPCGMQESNIPHAYVHGRWRVE